MTTCKVPGSNAPVTITLTEDLDLATLFGFKPFADWTAALHKNSSSPHPWTLHAITVQSAALSTPGSLGSLALAASLRRPGCAPDRLDCTLVLRAARVNAAVLMLVRPRDGRAERQVVLTEKKLSPSADPDAESSTRDVLAIPTCGVDAKAADVEGAVVKEVEAQTGVVVGKEELVDLTAMMALGASGEANGSFRVFLWEKVTEVQEVETMKARIAAAAAKRQGQGQGQGTGKTWSTKDGASLAALALYQGLIRERKIQR